MSIPIEGMEPKIDGRTREARSMRAGLRSDDVRSEIARHDTRADSVREAEEYARELMEQLGDTVYHTDEFYIDPNIVPAGWVYQYRRQSVAGKEDPHYMVGLKRNGWREVPVSRHRELMPKGWEGAIEKKGLVLMELPKVLVDRRQAADLKEARDIEANAEAMLGRAPPNTGPRNTKSPLHQSINTVEREFMSPNAPPVHGGM